jgi:hypothetical protein
VDVTVLPERMFEKIINQGRLEVADELFAEDFVDHGPMGDLDGLGFPATGRRFETVSPNTGRLRDGRAVEH